MRKNHPRVVTEGLCALSEFIGNTTYTFLRNNRDRGRMEKTFSIMWIRLHSIYIKNLTDSKCYGFYFVLLLLSERIKIYAFLFLPAGALFPVLDRVNLLDDGYGNGDDDDGGLYWTQQYRIHFSCGKFVDATAFYTQNFAICTIWINIDMCTSHTPSVLSSLFPIRERAHFILMNIHTDSQKFFLKNKHKRGGGGARSSMCVRFSISRSHHSLSPEVLRDVERGLVGLFAQYPEPEILFFCFHIVARLFHLYQYCDEFALSSAQPTLK